MKLGQGYVFTGVCHSVNGGGVCLSACWDTHPLPPPPEQTLPQKETPPRADTPQSRHPPGADTPWSRHPLEQTPPQSRHPPEQTPPGADTPPSRHTSPVPWLQRACWEIRSTCRQYASYWNAILFNLTLRTAFRCSAGNAFGCSGSNSSALF